MWLAKKGTEKCYEVKVKSKTGDQDILVTRIGGEIITGE
jgi:hypothetical protein